MGIGELVRAKLLSAQQESAVTTDLVRWHREDPDPGIHGAAEWSLRQLGALVEIAEARESLATGNIVGDRMWYLTKQSRQTLVVLRPEGEFLMGSPVTEVARFEGPTGQNEIRHRRRIGRTFAIGAHEVTLEQFKNFREEHAFDRTKAREQDAPANVILWYDAAAYCNWLSGQEGIPRDQWCYDPDQAFAEGMSLYADYLTRTGYRLPTEAEWEHACRAGATTAYSFGETEELLAQYGWYRENSGNGWTTGWTLPVGSLKPNDAGLFDMHGNVMEWCQDASLGYSRLRAWLEDQEQTGEQTAKLSNSMTRVLRGGSSGSDAAALRSASRSTFLPSFYRPDFGFRVARTYPLSP